MRISIVSAVPLYLPRRSSPSAMKQGSFIIIIFILFYFIHVYIFLVSHKSIYIIIINALSYWIGVCVFENN